MSGWLYSKGGDGRAQNLGYWMGSCYPNTRPSLSPAESLTWAQSDGANRGRRPFAIARKPTDDELLPEVSHRTAVLQRKARA